MKKIYHIIEDKPLSAHDRILFTAHDLFYRDGIRATGVDKLIAESQVTKTTFYRHFPSKNDLILKFLEFRHQKWRNWFSQTLEKNGNTITALAPTMSEWFNSKEFRGCAFINSLTELGTTSDAIVAQTKHHKEQVAIAIEKILPESVHKTDLAGALAIAIDGAIIKAQYDEKPDKALRLLNYTVLSIVNSE